MTALPAWMYRDPLEIADGLRERTKREEKAEKRKEELHLAHRRRRIKSLVKMAKRGGLK